MAKNPGKIFEECFTSSINKDEILVKRFNDNAASFGGGTNTRFASTNECDFELFEPKSRTLYFFELKSTFSSLTYWREDFEGKSFNIKKNQILGLQKFNKYDNTVCGLIINFRNESNDTFFIAIDEFVNYTKDLGKKSINIHDVIKMNPIRLDSTKKITRYKYDVDKLLDTTKIL